MGVDMIRSGAHNRRANRRHRAWWEKPASALVCCVTVVSPMCTAVAGAAATIPLTTTSYYEHNANPLTLYRQGEAAGKAGAQGIVILDFGRPADNGVYYGTLSFSGRFLPFNAIAAGVENYIRGYYRYAPSYTSLNVALGTNNSCGTGQPCGTTLSCGCPDEPPDFIVWGGQLALAVEEVDGWATALRAEDGFTDKVQAVAADDAEPAYDPGYQNTYDVLAGYARAVNGTFPTMVDYGSADADFWSESQLLQVAYGFRPDVPMPQIYYSNQAAQWAALMSYAKARRGEKVAIYGVLTTGAGTNSPEAAYSDMLLAAALVTQQSSIPWLSTILR
jgi:hypothetical protein